MVSHLIISSLTLVAVVAAQGRNSGSGAPPMDPTPKSPFEQFVERLKLDEKEQQPAVVQIFTQSAAEASPLAQEVARIRQRILDAEVGAKADDLKTALEAHTTAAGKMAALEARAFTKVFALLKSNQKSKAADGFELIGGVFQLVAPSAGRGRRGDEDCGAPDAVDAQRGGGGGGGGGGASLVKRLDQLTLLMTLDKDQKDQAKKLLDEAHKAAAPIRKELTVTRAALAAVVTSGKPQADLDAAASAYAVHTTSMTGTEMKALAGLAALLTPEQRANTSALQSAVFAFRGIFFDDKWNVVPDGRSY